ncbi:MAG TPA: hypothetical protein VGB06_08230 [Solirubrobacterales bacterium]
MNEAAVRQFFAASDPAWRWVLILGLRDLRANATRLGELASAESRGDKTSVLTYVRLTAEEVVVEQRFLELDRATLSIDRLAAELSRYACLFKATGTGGEPVWIERYAWFPPVLCVLAGGERPALERRRETAVAMLSRDRSLLAAPEVSIRFCLAEDLAEAGPFEPIFTDLRDPERPTDWLVEEPGA